MSSFILIAMAAVVPLVAPLPASMASLLGPAYMVLFGVTLLKAGNALRRDSVTTSPDHVKDAWATPVPQSSATTI